MRQRLNIVHLCCKQRNDVSLRLNDVACKHANDVVPTAQMKKSKPIGLDFLAKGYKKDIFGSFAYEFKLSRK